MTGLPMLVVGHGTRSDSGVAEFNAFMGRLQRRPDPQLRLGSRLCAQFLFGRGHAGAGGVGQGVEVAGPAGRFTAQITALATGWAASPRPAVPGCGLPPIPITPPAP